MSAIDQDFVRDLIERHSDASGGNGRDFHNGAYAAIADEMAQAVEATLGESPRLPHFWTHDGVLHIEATRMPTRIVVCEGGTCEFVPKRELDASEAENAKLRELLLDVADVLEEHTKLRELAERLRSAVLDGADNARDVFAENAKLRKLLLDVWNDAMQFDDFWDYVHDDGEIYNEDELPRYQERMRELGVDE